MMKKTIMLLPPELIREVDGIVGCGRYTNRSEFVREALRKHVDHVRRDAEQLVGYPPASATETDGAAL